MKGITIRFGDSSYEAIRQEAVNEGLGLTAFIREAAFARAVMLKAARGEYDHLGSPDFARAIRQALDKDRD